MTGFTLICAVLIGFATIVLPAQGGTFTWTNLVSGNATGSWASQGNWSGGTLPTTTNDTADFSTLNITAASTVSLNGNQNINKLVFADATTASHDWTVAPGTPAGSILTLGGTAPEIRVINRTAIISAKLAGSVNWTKTGVGTLRLAPASSNTNSFSGGLAISNGRVDARQNFSKLTGLGAPDNIVTIYSDGTLTTGGQLMLNGFGTSGLNALQPIVIQGPGESGGNINAALRSNGFNTTQTNNGTITLDGSGTYRIQNFQDNLFVINGAIARSGANSGTLIFDCQDWQSTVNRQITVNGQINNNGGPVTLTGSWNVGTLLLNTNGNNLGAFTLNGYAPGGSISPSNNLTLRLGIHDALTANQSLTVNHGTFDLAGFSQTVSNFTASANSALLFSVNKTNAAATNGYFVVNGTLSVSGGALTVSNMGPAFQVGDRIKLFNQGVNGFSSINLPPGYNWVNRLAFDGSIQVGTGVPATYYVSPSGADTNAGSIGAPFKTLAAAVGQLAPGDTLYVRAGTYRETLIPVVSGTSNAPITISAYSNEVVTITGCDVVTNTWSFLSNGIYSTTVGWDLGQSHNQVFVDGVLQHEARYPDWTPTNSLLNPPAVSVTVSSNYTITSAAFSALGDMSGARFLGGVDPNWAWQNGVISSNSGSTLYLNSNAVSGGWWWPNARPAASAAGFGFLYGKLDLLDTDGEWFLNSATTNLYLRITGGANPAGHTVELKRRNWCVDINYLNHVKVRGIQTRAGAIRLNGAGNELDDCESHYLSHFLDFASNSSKDGGRAEGGGVVVGGSGNVVRNCTIRDTAGSGLIVGGNDHLITRNHIYNINYSGTYAAPLILSGTNHTVSFNSMHDSGRDIMQPGGKGHTITYNDLAGCGWLTKDLGAIYTYGNNSISSGGRKTRIAYNWIHDGRPTLGLHLGIYFDSGCRNFLVDHNVVWNFIIGNAQQHGVYMNSPSDGQEIYHNTIFNCLPYNDSTFTTYPDLNPDPSYWTSTNQHLFFTGKNNLILRDAVALGSTLVNPGACDFRPLAGSAAVDPATTNYTVAWSTTDGVTGVPPDFSLYMNPGYLFSYQETAGYGIALPGINDGFSGTTPDTGAYEYGGPYWRPGPSGWAVEQAAVQNNGALLTASNAVLQGTLLSAGSSAATVRVFWGASDGGTNTGGWPNQNTIGTGYTGSFISVTQLVGALSAGDILSFRFYATNANGVAWSDQQTVRVPAALTWDADTGTTAAQDGSGNWNTTDANWWNGWANGTFHNADSATFGVANGAAGMVTVNDTNLTAAQVTFNAAGSGSYLITNVSGQSLTLDSGGLTVNASATLGVPLVLGASQSWNVAGGQTLSVVGADNSLNLGAATLSIAGAGNALLQSPVMGNGGLTVGGTATVTLSGTNTYAGDTTVSSGTLKLGASEVIPDGAGKSGLTLAGTLDLNGRSETINGLNGSGAVTNSAGTAASLTVGAGDALGAFNGRIADGPGPVSLTKIGTGSQVLFSPGSYSGGTRLQNGTLGIGDSTALGSGTLTLSGGTTLSIATNLTMSNAIVINAPATIDVSTHGPTLAGNISTGATNAGLSLNGASTARLIGTNVLTADPVSGSPANALSAAGGTLELAGGSTRATNVTMFAAGGDLLVSGGTHHFQGSAPDANRLGIKIGGNGRSLTVTGGSVSANNLSIGFGGNNSTTLNMNGGILTLGSFGWTLNFGNNTGAGAVSTLNLNGGTLATGGVFRGGGSSPASNNIINLNGGTFQVLAANANFLAGNSLGMTVNVLTNGAFFDTAGFDITVTNSLLNGGGDGGLTKQGAGILTLAGSSANTFTGLTTVQAGELRLNKTAGLDAVGEGGLSIWNGATVRLLAANQVDDASSARVEGTFNLNGQNETVDALAGGSTGVIEGGSGAPTFVVGAYGGSGAFAGTIRNAAGSLSLTKLGAGQLTLAGTNTYSGTTAVSNGTLKLDGALLGANTCTVFTGATLAGNGLLKGPVIVNSSGTIAPGSGIGILTISNHVTLNSGAVAWFELNKTNAPATNDYLIVSGALNVTNSVLNVTNLGPGLVAGDSFELLSKPTGGFTTVNLPPLNPGLAWINKLEADGSIAVVATIPDTPTNILFSVIGSTLALSWPSNYLGWILQSQTNPLAIGLQTASNAWFDLPGTASVTSTNLTIAPENPSVFYRLRHP